VGLPAYAAAMVLRKKFIVKIVGDYAWEQSVQRFGVEELLDDFLGRTYGFRVEMFRSIERFVARAAQKIIVPSHYFGTVVERWGIGTTKIQVIYNDVSVRDVPLRAVARAGLKMRQDEIKFVSVGRLVPWKGFAMLVDIMPKVMETYPNAKLVIIGDGPEYVALNEKVRQNNLQNNVFLAGKLEREDVLRHVRSADIFLLNTAYEGFSHQMLEALSLSTPVISTDAGGNKEILRDGSNALIAGYNRPEEWLAAILRLLDNSRFGQVLAARARDDVEVFLGHTMINQLVSVIQLL